MVARRVRRALLAVGLALAGASVAGAHSEHDGAAASAGADATGAVVERTVERTVELLPEQAAPVVEVALGERVRLVVTGAGAGALHLHGYDVEVEAEAGAPAVFAFDARHTGRFPLTAHGVDDLLGSGEKALLYVEVRDR
ncbi:MAG TPA: hypothetical protein VMM55_08375 [Thermohalobaculum sp.]|nr:hypothetical protein [Thermohalobaculum sp.]